MEWGAFSSQCLSTQRSPRSILCSSSLSCGNEPEASSWYTSLNLSGVVLVVPALCLQTLSAQSTDKKPDKVHPTSQASLHCYVTDSLVTLGFQSGGCQALQGAAVKKKTA